MYLINHALEQEESMRLYALNNQSLQYLVLNSAEEAHVGRDTAINVCQWLQKVCTTKLLSMPIQLHVHVGGLGKVVQIDKILFKHKSKVRQYTREQQVIIKCYHINRVIRATQPSSAVWVFGMAERCCHSTPDHTAACSKWLNCVIRLVGSI